MVGDVQALRHEPLELNDAVQDGVGLVGWSCVPGKILLIHSCCQPTPLKTTGVIPARGRRAGPAVVAPSKRSGQHPPRLIRERSRSA